MPSLQVSPSPPPPAAARPGPGATTPERDAWHRHQLEREGSVEETPRSPPFSPGAAAQARLRARRDAVHARLVADAVAGYAAAKEADDRAAAEAAVAATYQAGLEAAEWDTPATPAHSDGPGRHTPEIGPPVERLAGSPFVNEPNEAEMLSWTDGFTVGRLFAEVVKVRLGQATPAGWLVTDKVKERLAKLLTRRLTEASLPWPTKSCQHCVDLDVP